MINKKLINTGGAEAAFLPSQHFETVTYTGNGSTQSVGGFINRGAVFNGSSSKIDLPNFMPSGNASRSVSMWIKTTQTTAATLFQYGGSSTNLLFNFRINDGGTGGGANTIGIGFFANDFNRPAPTLMDGSWHHVVATYDGTNAKIYIDGTQTGADFATGGVNTTATNAIIGSNGASFILNGTIDQVRIFDKALSSDEVTTLYGETAASTSKSVTDIFEDNSGVALYQLDGNANDTGGVSGKFGSGFVSSGESGDEYIELPDALSRNQSQTLSAWIYPVTQSTDTGTAIRLSEDDNMAISYNTSGQFEISGVRDSSDTYATFTNVTKSANQWYHIAIARNASQIKLYIDGSLVETISWSGNLYSVGGQPYGNRIGQNNLASQNFTRKFAGKVDDVRVYSDELTLTEVGYIYNNTTASIPTDNLVAHYKLDGNALDETGIYSGTPTNVIYAYDGTATNVTYQKAIDFQPDLVWIKSRTQNLYHFLIDSVRGDGLANSLSSNTADGESFATEVVVNSLDSNGFTLNADDGSGYYGWNMSSQNYVAWCFKAADTTTTIAANTVGNTIASDVRANQAAGFSIVKYTKSGTSGTMGHGLTSAPEIIFEKRTDGTAYWNVRVEGITANNQTIYLNQTTGVSTHPSLNLWTTPTTSVFGYDSANAAAGTFIAYCFHSVEGYSKIGSYTGNGTTSNIIETGFEPAFVIIKCSSQGNSYQNWFIHDNTRIVSGNLAGFAADLSNAEFANSACPSFLSNGFEINTSGGEYNASGQTYIYLAIAADPDVTQPTVENSFDVVTYTGNGGAQSIDTDFKPDLVWIKDRSGSSFHNLNDSVRGTLKIIQSNTTTAEQNAPNGGVGSFDSNGFTTGTTGAYSDVSGSGKNYVAWCWKAGDHDDNLPQINTNGTIDSVVSVNPEAGFSIVKYTGTFSAATVGHGLSSAPEMVIVKNTDSATNWWVWHTALGDGTKYLKLNGADAVNSVSSIWNSTVPTSTVFSVANDGGSNGSGNEIIAYCFHSVSGYQKIGSYSGNSSTQSINVGFQPRFILLKAYNVTYDWVILDNVRGADNRLFPDLSDAESPLANRLTFTSTGFDLLTTSYNTTGADYIYLAIA